MFMHAHTQVFERFGVLKKSLMHTKATYNWSKIQYNSNIVKY